MAVVGCHQLKCSNKGTVGCCEMFIVKGRCIGSEAGVYKVFLLTLFISVLPS